jgi:hypothetical protein
MSFPAVPVLAPTARHTTHGSDLNTLVQGESQIPLDCLINEVTFQVDTSLHVGNRLPLGLPLQLR